MNLNSKTKIKVLDILLTLDINQEQSSIDDFQSQSPNFDFLSDVELVLYLRMLENEHLIDIEDYDADGNISRLHIYPNAYIYIEEHDRRSGYEIIMLILAALTFACTIISLIR